MRKKVFMINTKKMIFSIETFIFMPRNGKLTYINDALNISRSDPGIEDTVSTSLAWLCRAQDHSISHDGGVARDYSLIKGWGSSYPETTGYIIPTMLSNARLQNNPDLRDRAERMLDWLLSIQMECGGFQGGLIDSQPVVPVTFNTGQILIGLAAGVLEFGERYRPAMIKAAEWLVQTQDSDGCWRKYETPFAAPGEKAYETHVAWGLLEAAKVDSNKRFASSAFANIAWALRQQQPNGWFDKCCLLDPEQPLTHTIGYVLRGVLEGYSYSQNALLLESAMRTADGLLAVIDENGFIPGRIDSSWRGAVRWACLTGTVQIAHCWLLLYRWTGCIKYRDAAYRANSYVRKTMIMKGCPDFIGGIRGSSPIYGGYGTNEFLNWASKFFIDAQLLELQTRQDDSSAENGQCHR